MGAASAAAPGAAAPEAASGTPVFSSFAGTVEIVDIVVSVGDSVSVGQKVAAIEAMKAQHDIKAQCAGKVTAIHIKIGDEVDSTKPIMTIA
jgi:biotin carboxyl carrier protein